MSEFDVPIQGKTINLASHGTPLFPSRGQARELSLEDSSAHLITYLAKSYSLDPKGYIAAIPGPWVPALAYDLLERSFWNLWSHGYALLLTREKETLAIPLSSCAMPSTILNRVSDLTSEVEVPWMCPSESRCRYFDLLQVSNEDKGSAVFFYGEDWA